MATLYANGHFGGRGRGAAGPRAWLRATADGLEAHDHDGSVRRFAPGELNRLLIVASTKDAPQPSVGESADPAPTAVRRCGRAQFCRGEEVLLALDLDVWGTGLPYAPWSPAWDPEASALATGVAEVADVLGIPVEQAERRLPESRRTRALLARPLRRLDTALMVLFPLAIVNIIAFAVALQLDGPASNDLSSLVVSICAAFTGLQQLAGLVVMAVADGVAARRRAGRRATGELVLAPRPAGPAPRDLVQRARVLRWNDRLLVQGADGQERVIPAATDRNGPVSASLRGSARGDGPTPERFQLRDARGTVLVDLDWADWFGGDPDGDGVRRLCEAAGVEPPGAEVLPDDLPENVRPWGGAQAGRAEPSVGWSRYAFSWLAVLQVAHAVTAGLALSWPLVWPSDAALAVMVLTGILPWAVRRVRGRQQIPGASVAAAQAPAEDR
ncbi:MAG TPA: hypothetical protein VFG88_10935 [Nocardioidaceae bacterium]|nr:hypothetical protein [Nocardioidaceae bacterium]